MTSSINRREFVALSTAVAAASAISRSAVAGPIASSASTSKALQIPSPALARLITSKDNPAIARILPITRLANPTERLSTPQKLTLTPLPCVDGRLDKDASITIELHYPTPNLYATLYNAHNITIPNQSIPVYPSATQLRTPRNTFGQSTLKITQRIGSRAQSKRITLNTSAPCTYLLAIPTATHSSNPNFRFTSAILDTNGNITKLTNPMPAASSRCAYFSITLSDNLSDKSTGE